MTPQRIPGIQSGSNLFDFVAIEDQHDVVDAWRAQQQSITEVYACILRMDREKLESTEQAGIEEFSFQVLLAALDLVRARCATRLRCFPKSRQKDLISTCRQLALMIPRSCFTVGDQECRATQFLAGIRSFLEPRSHSVQDSIETSTENTQVMRSNRIRSNKRQNPSSHMQFKRSISIVTIESDSEAGMTPDEAQQLSRRSSLPRGPNSGLANDQNGVVPRIDELLGSEIESSPEYLSPTPAPRQQKRRRSAYDQVIADLQEKVKEKDRMIKEREKKIHFLHKFISVRTGMNEADLLLAEKRVLVMGQTYKCAWTTASGARLVDNGTRGR
ncbi:hypothetical protein PV10_03868 [Exophiala mesophila]|uniref:Uncharacterized protein n=1 Tax=Exophiala mesophila TaxID=212818 RepID=A0A0D1ZFF2_EXOME|nr:uncharacterized protein PV10_03868 [Exophiala mesophila]KIV92594.1 hypothetical protein PV10_03868 [Exophiala mesophila]